MTKEEDNIIKAKAYFWKLMRFEPDPRDGAGKGWPKDFTPSTEASVIITKEC